MKNRTRMISTKLMISFTAIFFMILVIASSNLWMLMRTHNQTDVMYNHPLQVRKAVDHLSYETAQMSILMRNLLLFEDLNKEDVVKKIYEHMTDANKQLEVLNQRYLGPVEDINKVETTYLIWESFYESTLSKIYEGDYEYAKTMLMPDGQLDRYKSDFTTRISVIDKFALAKADELQGDSQDSFNNSLALSGIFLLISIAVLFYIARNIFAQIKPPLNELHKVISQVDKGDLSIRDYYNKEDEFEKVFNAFNGMVEKNQIASNINGQSEALTKIMLHDENMGDFFINLLQALLMQTDGQLGVVYLSSDSEDPDNFTKFTSIGTDDRCRKSFDRHKAEGIFGRTLFSREVNKISVNSNTDDFIYNVPFGDVFPKEIISIPISKNSHMIACIILGSINGFSALSLELVKNMHELLSVRVTAILANEEIKSAKQNIELQNQELVQQQLELRLQAREIEQQKTELKRQNEKLTEDSHLKTSFLSTMSHELRTPLNSIIALSGVLLRRLKDQIPEDEYGYIGVIGKNGKNLYATINDILDIARIESGKTELAFTEFDLGSIINDLVDMLHPIAKEKNIDIVYLQNQTEMFVISDEDKLRHIIQNLMGNAVKFTEKGHVEVSTFLTDGYAIITVIDTGMGIAKEHLPYIFDEFRQADDRIARQFEGTGLGLALAKKLTELLKGTLNVTSTLGHGSEFTIKVPVSLRENERRIMPHEIDELKITQSPKGISTAMRQSIYDKGHNILVVEDSEPALIQIKDALDELGFNLIIAKNGAEALITLDQFNPDAVILDLMMPKVDGFQVLSEIRNFERTASLPVLVLTAKHIDKDDLIKLKHNKVHQLIQKGSLDRKGLQDAVLAMFLPMASSDAKQLKTEDSNSERLVVLVVEDNPDNRLVTRVLLKDTYTVIEAEDGETAIEMASEYAPNLILMDIALPNMDGVEAFSLIRSNPMLAHIPIIAVTANAMNSDQKKYLDHGFDAFIAKPIIETNFIETINAVLYHKYNIDNIVLD